MNKLIAIGEALIDFISLEKGLSLRDADYFKRVAGGAPANVASAVARLGRPAVLLTKLGTDAFGDHIIEKLNKVGVNTRYIVRTDQAKTGLAFVSLDKDGDRDFTFYRHPSSDLLYEPDELPDIFQKGDILHFCSVDLIESPMKHAHIKAIELAQKRGSLISFDPNVRLPLWNDSEALRKTILEFIPHANLLKISHDELPFITGISDEICAIRSLFVGEVQAILLTHGAQGASVYTPFGHYFFPGYPVDVVDTTGAGDAFIGSFIYQLLAQGATKKTLHTLDFNAMLQFSNAVGAMACMKPGAIDAMPTLAEVQQFIAKYLFKQIKQK